MKKWSLFLLTLGLSFSLVSCGENERSVKKITLSDYTDICFVNEPYTFDGKVTASFTDNSTQDVTSECTYSTIDTTRAGEQNLTVSYTYNSFKLSEKAKINVIQTITPEEAVSIINSQEMNAISENEFYIRGVTANVELDSLGFNGGFFGTNLKFRSILGNGVATKVDDIQGKEVVILGYLENYNGTYQIPYLPENYSPTGKKYNGKLISVFHKEEEQIEPTHVSLSPVSKTLKVGETSTLIATVLPENATDKSIVWSSSSTNVCTVNSKGEITAKSEGRAVITAKSVNDLSATCVVIVEKNGSDPVDGIEHTILFNNFESDGQTELTASSLLDQITAGNSYVDSVASISKVYKGTKGLKFGSSRTGGSLSINLSADMKELICKEIVVEPKVYGNTSTTVTIYADDNQIVQGSSSNSSIKATLPTSKSISNVKVSTNGRAYIGSITLVCEELNPVPVTGISIPSTKNISTGNSDTLTVTYTPSNANMEKGITWTSSKTSVATVTNDGVVSGISAGTATITATSEGGFKATCLVTVSNIAVTGVSISSTSESLSIGGTKQLSATVSPSNATNKNVTWSSSNSAIASVSTTGLVTALAVGNATITVKSVDGNKTAQCNVTVSEVTKDAWTILIYMCGADLESESGLATSDIKEILSVKNQPDDVNIVIETGGAKSWSLSSSYLSGATKIDASKLSRWHVADKKLVLDETLTYASMGSSSTLQSFVEYGINEYPAEKTGVIFWNHGGAMYGCCYDEKKNDDSLVNSEMKTAFSKALSNTGSSKLEFVGYDTCLTQVQDIAEFNSNYFNYMIASEEAEAGEGWDYDTWVDDLYSKKETTTILKAIVDGFISDNGGASSTRSDQTLSYLDLSQMAAYKSAFESFATALKSKLSSSSVTKATFAKWMDTNVKAFCVDSDQDEAYYCLFDVKDMLNKLSSNSSYNPGSSYITAVNNAFTNLVKYSVAQKGAGNAYGLGCIYCQSSSYSSYLKSAYTSTETNFSNWLSFCKTYSYLA